MSYIGQTLPTDVFGGYTTDTFAGDGSATTFTLSQAPFNEQGLIVVINNVIQQPTTNYTVSGTTLTIVGTAVASGDVIYARHTGVALPIGEANALDLQGQSDKLILDADADTTISADTDDQIDIKIGGNDVIALTASEFAFNDGSANIDFRVESDNETSMLHVNAGTDTVLIGTATPTDQWFNADATYVPGFQTFGNGNTDGRVSAFVNNQADAGGPIIGISKSRGTASNSYTVVQDNDQLGIITFQGADGTNLVEGARIAADVDGTPGADDMPGRLEFHTTADGASSGTERMRIHSTGNVSIGSTNGRSPLEIVHSDTGAVPTDTAMGATASDDNISIGVHNESNSATFCGLAFETRTSGAGRVLLANEWYSTYLSDLLFVQRSGASTSNKVFRSRSSDASGEFYFGADLAAGPSNPVSSNSATLQGVGIFPDAYSVFARSNSPTAYFNRMNGDGDIIVFREAGTTQGSISTSGATTSYNPFTGSHWSRLEDNSKPEILKGTIMDTINKKMDWYEVVYTDSAGNETHHSIQLKDGEKVGDDYQIADPYFTETKYEQVDIFYTAEDELPEGKSIGDRKPGMDGKNVGDVKDAKPVYTGKIALEPDVKHVYSKISDTADSKKVYGVFFSWDDDDNGDDGDVNDMFIAQVGTFIIRVHKDVTVEAGDLLVSNGDGTAKLQDDDIIRSKTVAKVNSNIKVETYSDGSYTVPCTLHC
jgi:hypothetical protein